MKKVINISDAPKPIGPYSQGILAGDTLYISGQIALDPYTGQLVNSSIDAQVRQIMKNIRAILREVEMDFADIVKVSIFLSDMGLYSEVNELYAGYFTEAPPAREALAAKGLPKGVEVEISCIAVKPVDKEVVSVH
jgi:2-iminobutanoate/2-iminopropanoate deaminase